MHIVSRKVTSIVVDTVDVRVDEWDGRVVGSLCWREHMAQLLNQRAKKIAATSTPLGFFENMVKFSKSIGFGSVDTIARVTEQIYGGQLVVDDNDLNELEEKEAA